MDLSPTRHLAVTSSAGSASGASTGSPSERIAVRLQSIAYAARETHLYEFVRLDGRAFPDTAPGAHVDVHLPHGITRSYSLVRSGPGLSSCVVGVKRDPRSRGGSSYLHEQLRVGTELSLSAPRNHFPLVEDAPHSVLIAGGIGITPIWCMAQRLAALGASWELWYSARSRADMAFLAELGAFGDRVHLHFDDEVGGVMDLAAIVSAAAPGAHLYGCGPAPMLAAFSAAAEGRDPATVHLEHFGAVQAAAVEGGYVVRLARSGGELAVPPGSSLLDALTAHGIAIESSCREGICGCCEVAVLEGEVDHRDAVLSESERAANRSMMACCSGARSARLVLDL